MNFEQLSASTSFRELFRYRKGRRLRIYNLRELDDETAELWVVSQEGGAILNSHRMATFDNPDEAIRFLDECERELRQGGWIST